MKTLKPKKRIRAVKRHFAVAEWLDAVPSQNGSCLTAPK
jgi:hypothetical protein